MSDVRVAGSGTDTGTGVSRRRFGALAVAGVAATAVPGSARAAQALRRAYLGTYTTQPGGGTGIGLASYRRSGQLASTGVLVGVQNPSFLALSPDRRTLYAVDERAAGAVTAVRVGAGAPEVLGPARGTGGADPCH